MINDIRHTTYDIRKIITVSAFSMVELMITMVIVSTCLVLTLRVFSLSAKTVSKAAMETRCTSILKDKYDQLYLSSIEADGLDAVGVSENIMIDDIEVSYICEISNWNEDKDQYSEYAEEGEDTGEVWDLLEVDSSISWGTSVPENKMGIKGIFPAKGIRHEYVQ